MFPEYQHLKYSLVLVLDSDSLWLYFSTAYAHAVTSREIYFLVAVLPQVYYS